MSARAEELDRLSRLRALSDAESFELERELFRGVGKRVPRGLTKALARQGIKRSGKRVLA